MEQDNQFQRPWFFNLKKDGESAVVRILHTKVDTIEKMVSHRITLNDKRKKVKCLGENCPLCKNGQIADEKIYIHLYDYTDNMEKVWERSDKIMNQLAGIQEAWLDISNVVMKITRVGDQFPQYRLDIQDPNNYSKVDKNLIDKPIAKYYALNRNVDEINEFISTGKFPERKAYIPKEEYIKQKQAENAETNQNIENKEEEIKSSNSIIDSLPF